MLSFSRGVLRWQQLQPQLSVKVFIQPLYSQLNPGIGDCPLGCDRACKVVSQTPQLQPAIDHSCPLSRHQAETYVQVVTGTADIIFNTAATGDGKSLAAFLASLLNPSFRIMGLYPTIELVEDQTRSQSQWQSLFGWNAEERIDRLFGEELSRRVQQADSNKFQELLLSIQTKPILLTNPDIFHLITHHQYRDPAYSNALLPLALAEFPDLWVFDEFHIFGAHQEAAVLNSLALIRRTQSDRRPRRFLFTSATPKPDFIAQLKQADLQVAEVRGRYADEPTPGYRQILQEIELKFVELKETDAIAWLDNHADEIRIILEAESRGRGLIILNSVAQAGRASRLLAERLPGVIVREISGRIDRQERSQTQADVQFVKQPVLIVGTSAVDVGVDFKIHLLIFESSDSATIVQRLGRLGRHPGFSAYKAFVLISGRTPWVMARLTEQLRFQHIDRSTLRAAIDVAFEPPKEFQDYRRKWGALQAQGMLWKMGEENAKVAQPIRNRLIADLKKIYGSSLNPWLNDWKDLGKTEVGKATQIELLRFRGGSALQAGVWDDQRFYTYDLLRLLPYALVEVVDRAEFLQAAIEAGHHEAAFPDRYIQTYLRIQEWVDDRFDLSLHCNRDSHELNCCQLSLINKLSLVGHPQAEVVTCLSSQKLLAYLVPVNHRQLNSHWEVSHALHLSPLFGLYRLTDGSEKAYACAFNQDALLLDALGGRLKKSCRTQPQSLIF